ncbi:prion-inhibition and propagation, helo domain-containing protein [Hypoxylon trugodes]|uniref:prion-inhibition and propagation, helo domain-containing protein n=1 Tax=Hypoxylon trugodes TaxID=326681 RepID=UPI00218F56E8|nr:prion-inhibition and propagation, helo domain-containing protein [Hypoxylon trugodes]KAI1382849.1 prion-inhibition and propagation, helo domain-containing protein [Hypoxylon trugodes]
MDCAGNVSSLLYFAVEFFDGIQIARGFRDQFETYQLKLDIMQLRLSRWGEAAGVITSDSNGEDLQLSDSNQAHLELLKKATGILETIQSTLHKAKQNAESIRSSLPRNEDERFDPESEMPDESKKIRSRFRECLRKRRAQLRGGHRGS